MSCGGHCRSQYYTDAQADGAGTTISSSPANPPALSNVSHAAQMTLPLAFPRKHRVVVLSSGRVPNSSNLS